MATMTTPAPYPTPANFEKKRRHALLPGQIQNILVAIDFSDGSTTALRYAASIAEGFGAALTLFHVAHPCVYPEDLSAGLTIEQVEKRWLAEQNEKMDVLRKTINEGIPESVVVASGTTWKRIVDMAREWNADLIVMGTHGATLKHKLIGSTAERVVRHAPCPVLVVPIVAGN
jgi:nucleotide-binding universal stress UspA family protein